MRKRPGAAAETVPPAEVGRPRSILEVRVFPGHIEIGEYYSEGQAEALAQALKAYGVRTERKFSSRCG
ncbi:MAG TPA: hypothetical protein VGL40_03160 [Bacillota bacterium]|jgi:hypothetical protein